VRWLVTGSFRGAMMGGGAFILLKGGCPRPKSAKLAEPCLAILPKILGIWDLGARPEKIAWIEFATIHSDMANLPRNRLQCYLDHRAGHEMGAVYCE